MLVSDDDKLKYRVIGVDLASGPDRCVRSVVGMVDGKVVHFKQYINEDDGPPPLDSDDK